MKDQRFPWIIPITMVLLSILLIGCPNNTGNEENDDSDTIYVIPNDISWEIVTNSPFNDYTVDLIIFENGMFIAASYIYDNINNDFLSKIAYSTDGSVWNLCQFDNDFMLVYDICYGNGKYVAACYNGQIGYSSNGIDWTFSNNTVFEVENIHSITFGKGIFIAGVGHGKLAYSYDGINWNKIQNTPFGSSMIYHLAYGNNIFVAGTQDGKLGYSIDGITWNIFSERIFGNSSVFELKFVKNYFIASSGHDIAYSQNGIYWEKQTMEIINNSYFIQAIAYGENLFLLGTGNGNIAFSNDLLSWKKVSDTKFGTDEPGRVDSINSIVYGNNKFIAVGYNGKIVYSVK
jgi:hypothetical protein